MWNHPGLTRNQAILYCSLCGATELTRTPVGVPDLGQLMRWCLHMAQDSRVDMWGRNNAAASSVVHVWRRVGPVNRTNPAHQHVSLWSRIR